mgnify:CR=1 FL=1
MGDPVVRIVGGFPIATRAFRAVHNERCMRLVLIEIHDEMAAPMLAGPPDHLHEREAR